jgi:hypothetical protein
MEDGSCEADKGKMNPIKSLQLHIEAFASTKLTFEGQEPLLFDEDLLEKFSKTLEGMFDINFPIIPVLLDISFELKPSISMPFKFQLGSKGDASLVLKMNGPVQTINVIGDEPAQRSKPDFSESYVVLGGHVYANLALGLKIGIASTLKICLLSIFCAGVSAEMEWEAMGGADFGLTTANGADCTNADDRKDIANEYKLRTHFTHYAEYCAADLVDFKAAKVAANEHGGLVLGMGLWYYVTMPSFKIWLFMGVGGSASAGGSSCSVSVSLDLILFDTLAIEEDKAGYGTYKSLSVVKDKKTCDASDPCLYTDALMRKQTPEERETNKFLTHPRVKFAALPSLCVTRSPTHYTSKWPTPKSVASVTLVKPMTQKTVTSLLGTSADTGLCHLATTTPTSRAILGILGSPRPLAWKTRMHLGARRLTFTRTAMILSMKPASRS